MLVPLALVLALWFKRRYTARVVALQAQTATRSASPVRPNGAASLSAPPVTPQPLGRATRGRTATCRHRAGVCRGRARVVAAPARARHPVRVRAGVLVVARRAAGRRGHMGQPGRRVGPRYCRHRWVDRHRLRVEPGRRTGAARRRSPGRLATAPRLGRIRRVAGARGRRRLARRWRLDRDRRDRVRSAAVLGTLAAFLGP